MSKIIDCRGLNCPLPVVKTKKAFEEIIDGSLTTIVDNEVARENLRKLGIKLNANPTIVEKEDLFYISFAKNNIDNFVNKEVENIHKTKEQRSLTILISNNLFGKGDEKLGSILMKSYFYTLSETKPLPEAIIFVNSGVKLTCNGSNCLEEIKHLHQSGVKILCCGTCLDFYNLKDELELGEITNMYTIVEFLNEANKTYAI